MGLAGCCSTTHLKAVPSPIGVGRIPSAFSSSYGPTGFVGSAAVVKSFIWKHKPYVVMKS